MNKVLLSTFVIAAALPAGAVLPPDAGLIQVHDMQMINQQRFRMEEINDFNNVDEEKARYQKKNAQSQTLMERIFNKETKFVDDDGEIKIQYEE